MGENVTDLELLKFAIDNGIINLALVQEQALMKKRDELLKQHKFDVWQGKDGRWRTKLPDDSMPDGKKLIAKSTKEKLEDAIVEFYKANVPELKPSIVTIRLLYPQWLEFKKSHTDRTMYIYRIDMDWKKFYENETLSQPILDKPIIDLNVEELDVWAHNICKKYNMTKKCYYNMSHIIRNVLEYAVEQKHIVDDNLFAKVKFKTQLFKKNVKPKDETQVFTKHEEIILTDLAIKKFKDNNNVMYLMIPMFFLTGMRLGELAALKFGDVHNDYISVHQMFGREAVQGEDGTWNTSEYEIVDSLKRNAPPREVVITPDVKKIVAMIKSFYWKNDKMDYEYLFINQKGNVPTQSSVDRMFYRLCDELHILRRSPHKTRKTYISTLIDSGMNLNFIREQVGHEDERTTLGNYCFNRKTKSETQKQLQKALAN